MYRSLLIAACISLLAVAAFAAEPATCFEGPAISGNARGEGGGNGNLDGILVDNLCTGTYGQGLSGCAYHSSWVALDYTPPSNVTVKQIMFEYCYNSSARKNTINFRLIEGIDPGVGSLVRSWDVLAANYEEVNTGRFVWGRPIYRVTIPIPDQSLTGKIKYWFAYTSPNSAGPNIIYWLVWTQLKEEQIWWYLNGSWGTGQAKGAGGVFDQSYRLYDAQSVGVAPTSFGRIKTLYH